MSSILEPVEREEKSQSRKSNTPFTALGGAFLSEQFPIKKNHTNSRNKSNGLKRAVRIYLHVSLKLELIKTESILFILKIWQVILFLSKINLYPLYRYITQNGILNKD